MPSKSEIRKQIKQIIKNKSPEDFANESAQIRANLTIFIEKVKKGILPFKYSPHVMAYYPLNDEVDIIESLKEWDSLSLPKMVENSIVAHIVEDVDKDLCNSKSWGAKMGGIKEPSDSCLPIKSLDHKMIEVVFVPGRAFDMQGNRIGRGRGHYDKFLLNVPRATKVGVCFHNQLFQTIPTEEHDVKLDYVITNRGIYGPNIKKDKLS